MTALRPPVRPAGRLAALARPATLVAALAVAVVLLWALAPGLFTGHDPVTGVPAERLQAPGAAHWFGTDHLGRDLYARTVHGTSLSVRAALLAIAVALVAGSAVGLVAGFTGGPVDEALMRGTDVLLAIPGLLLSLAVVTALGFGTVKVAIAVGVASVATFARVMRTQVLRVRHATYVEAARLAGAGRAAVLLRHVLPNAAGPVLALAAVELGAVILAVSALSFLGYGATPPTPEWGSLVAEGRDYLAVAWWYSTLPGLVVAVFVLAVGVLGRALAREGRTDR
ncbi:ABC transporter permease [Promicromonospora citrea]|uniref:ABC transporter permease n=1 Tax=Promicromonospora citrea TaxID=43677 RepID=A0A8H9L5X4_9MICO|nr:ABC transporter permease [Promicromonospora citrea]NNH51504.1 ABC transporter permease [Promicromonospora citrea]GGM40671.1 ABC transporter permease [Promicromonospora citrea]HEV6955761.1 ABC transporter permease [Promicromonospora sp.]